MTDLSHLAHEPRQFEERFRGACTEHSVSHREGPGEATRREDFRKRGDERDGVELAHILDVREVMPVAADGRRGHLQGAPPRLRSSTNGKGARSGPQPRCRRHRNIDDGGTLTTGNPWRKTAVSPQKTAPGRARAYAATAA